MPFDVPAIVTLVPLTQALPGARVRIAGVAAGQGLERRLTELGLPRGAELVVEGRMGRKGAVIVSVHGTRVAIGAGMAEKIEVAATA